MKASQATCISKSPTTRTISVRLSTLTLLATTLLLLISLPAQAATGTVYATGLNIPVGIIWLGSSERTSGVLHGHVWIADATNFCRLDVNAATGLAAINPNFCAPTLSGTPTGQPDFDPANGFVFIPTTTGIQRYSFNSSLSNPANEQLNASPVNLGQPGVLAVAYGPDKKLYFGGLKDALVHRLTTPEGRTQTIEDVGITAGTHPGATVGQSVFGMAFQGSDLYLNTKNFLQRFVAASVFCNGGCVAEDLNMNIAAVGGNRSTQVFFTVQGTSLPPTALSELNNVYDSISHQTLQLSGEVNSPATGNAYQAVHQFTVNGQTQAIFILDDTNLFPGGDLPPVAGNGRVVMLASTVTIVNNTVTSVPPASEPLPSFEAPIAPSVPPTLAGRSATLLGNPGSLTAPGMLFINGDVWALDAAQGICKANGGTIDSRTCVAVGIPGQSAFDAVNNFVYVPDKSPNSAGVWRIPYLPASKTLNGLAATLVAANKGLGGNQPQCASLGPDGSLYVSFVKNGSVLQIAAPNTTTNTVTQVASSSDGHGIKSLAWITRNVIDGFGNKLTFNDLYMLETSALTYSTAAITGTKSKGNILTTAKVANPMLMVSDGADTIYLANGGEVDLYIASTASQSLFTVGSGGSPITLFGSITGLSLAPSQGLLYIGDDPSGDASPGLGRMWSVSTK